MNPGHQTQKPNCLTCRLPRAEVVCDLCKDPLCRSCKLQPDSECFSLPSVLPDVLSHQNYCPRCFDTQVEPEILKLTTLVERAKEVPFWPKAYRGNIPVLKKGREELIVENGRDRDEVLLKLGFKAVELGFNGLIRGEIKSRKIRSSSGYQKMEWTARALPVQIDETRLEYQ